MLSALLILVVTFSLIFDFVNGFHDTANSIATVVSTRVMPPFVACLMSAVLNFAGALIATNVASTISSGIVDTHAATQTVVLAAVIGAIAWNLITWAYGIPSSSSHALIGGLLGGAIANAGFATAKWKGVLDKVIIPLVVSPVAGMIFAFILMTLITYFFAHSKTHKVGTVFRRLQVFSAALMSFSHGQNDAQKTMGIIALALFANGNIKQVMEHGKPTVPIPLWVMLACATVMGLGTAAGGWRIIKTVGSKIIRLEPVNGFAAETAGAAVILAASRFGAPVSTTHVISGSIFGVGAAKRLSAVRWNVAFQMISAWVITLPVSALFGAVTFYLLTLCGIRG
ncbi:MAG TPA: anion permease [Fimbriimonadaceae bacterium]|jgi:PiT family inorganic phosphate transporter